MSERPQPPAIRASDDERDHSVTLLRDAVVSGRLTLEEFSERVALAQQARTNRDLVALTADLPSGASLPAVSGPVKHRALASTLVRRGAWEIPARSSWRSVFGTIELDLRQARLPGAEIELEIYNLFGTVTVLVPPGVCVEVSGGGAFASQVIDSPPWPAPLDAPRLRIRTSGPGGTLYVRTARLRDSLRESLRALLAPGP